MSKTIITTNSSSQYLEYESDKGTTRLKSVTRETPRCSVNHVLRIDMLVGTDYHSTYEITEEQLEKIKSLEVKPTIKLKREIFAWGVLVANAIKGVSKDRGPLFNMLASRKFFIDYIPDDVIVVLTEGSKNFTAQIHCTDEIIESTETFKISNSPKESEIRKVVGVTLDYEDYDLLKELGIFGLAEKDGKYLLNAYYDGTRFRWDRLFEIKK